MGWTENRLDRLSRSYDNSLELLLKNGIRHTNEDIQNARICAKFSVFHLS